MSASKKVLRALVVKHTAQRSRHQAEALKLLDSHYRRFSAEIKSIVCTECNAKLNDCVRWTEKGQIRDSWGYTELDGGDLCHICDKNGWIGDIYVPHPRDTQRQEYGP